MAETANPTASPSTWQPAVMATAAALVAFIGLALTESDFVTMPLLCAGLLAARFVRFRLDDSRLTWAVRFVLYGLVAASNFFRASSEREGMGDPHLTSLVGELFAAELVLEMWLRKPEGGARGVVLIFFSGMVVLLACNTLDDRYVKLFVPLYVVCLGLALRSFRPPSEPDAARLSTRASQVMRGVALLCALAIGAGVHALFQANHTELTNWGMQVLHEVPTPEASSRGLSTSPTLSRSFGMKGTQERVLRLEGPAEVSHLRALSFDTYSQGHWEPARQQRRFREVNPRVLRGDASALALRATRLEASDDLVLAPLTTTGLDLPPGQEIQWAPDAGGPIVTQNATPIAYTVYVGRSENTQGLLCRPPDARDRQRLTAVPAEIDPGVRTLARSIVSAESKPLDVAHTVESYLMSHHGYSLDYNPGRGDPASNFLLSAKPAHCEYFAAGATLLLRCLGIPARYVIGYYAHEKEGDNVIVVRQADAHAWTEAWIDGTGWITLDATPGDGRPDKTEASVSQWTKLKEWTQDRLLAFRMAVDHLGKRGASAIAIGVIGVLIIYLLIRSRTGQKSRNLQEHSGYTIPAAEIATLAARFEALCRRQGLVCPPGQTWSEFLASLPPAESSGPPVFDINVARAFVQSYNQIRFGAPDTASRRAELQELLLRLESGKGESA